LIDQTVRSGSVMSFDPELNGQIIAHRVSLVCDATAMVAVPLTIERTLNRLRLM